MVSRHTHFSSWIRFFLKRIVNLAQLLRKLKLWKQREPTFPSPIDGQHTWCLAPPFASVLPPFRNCVKFALVSIILGRSSGIPPSSFTSPSGINLSRILPLGKLLLSLVVVVKFPLVLSLTFSKSADYSYPSTSVAISVLPAGF
ncbi:hypothetical protein Tco_0067100 [Tanacetum coccineum]